MKQFIGSLMILATLGGSWASAAVVPPADQRYSRDTSEVPSFQRHVLPLMGRLGCNGRACHGSFQGQGGFRLSLFGYDFQADHDALVAGDAPRVDLKHARESLMIAKPTSEEEHGGGKRFNVGSWEYRLLMKWIESGAPGRGAGEPDFVRLEIQPREIVFQRPGERTRLQVFCHWSDGTVEDVTPLCRFQTNDESVATVDIAGQVASVGRGDTHVVAFYDNGVLPVPVLLPMTDQHGPKYPTVAAPTKIDELVVAKLRKLGVVPSELADDQEFLRRVSLDITGTLPTAEEVLAFTSSRDPNKRQAKIDELLERPEYATWWATKLCDITGNRERDVSDAEYRTQTAEQWYRWIERRVAENVSYDDIVEGLVMASSRRPGQSYEDYCAEMTSYLRKENPADFTERETMPHYWSRRTVRDSNTKALAFSYSFLGVRLQCAECHKHPFDQWSQQDFQQFTAFFTPLSYGNQSEDRDTVQAMYASLLGGDVKVDGVKRREARNMAFEGKLVPFSELYVAESRLASMQKQQQASAKQTSGSRVITPHVLGGDEVLLTNYTDPRQPLMDWLRDPQNPYFARSIVNRVWAQYFNVGIVEPPDDMNLANAPSNRELLDYLATEFVRHDYDLKWLHRTITTSHAYQRSWVPNDTNELDTRNFSHALPRRLPAEALYDAVVCATAGSEQLDELAADPIGKRMIGLATGYTNTSTGTGGGRFYALSVFGKPTRETTCDCERSNSPTLLQTVFLRNDSELLALIDRRGGWLEEALSTTSSSSSASVAVTGVRAELLASIENLERQLAKAQAAGDKAAASKLSKRIALAKREFARQAPRQRTPAARAAAASGTAQKLDSNQLSALVRQAYLRTLSRTPTAAELSVGRTHLAAAETPKDGLRDLMWALINTKEFVVNH